MMKRILLLVLTALWLAVPETSYAQSRVKICFQTGTNVQSCQDVTALNPLPVTGINISVGSLTLSAVNTVTATVTNTTSATSLAVSVVNTPTNPVVISPVANAGVLVQNTVTVSQNNTAQVKVASSAAAPLIVSSPNGFGTFSGGALNVTVTNTTASPGIVSCTNCGATFSGGAVNVTVTNTIANSRVSEVNSASISVLLFKSAIPAGANTIGGVSIINTAAGPASYTCTNCGAASVTGPFNVTVTNTNANGQAAMASSSPVVIASNQSALNVTVANTTASPAIVTCTNCGAVSITTVTAINTVSPAGGATMLTATNLLTTPNAIKASAGQLYKLYCYNPNASVAYIQVFNTASGSVTPGTTKPSATYGIPATNAAGFANSPLGDQFTIAISAIATTTATGLTPPSTGVDCNFSFN